MLILLRARAELLVVMAAVQRRLSTTCGGERERERDESPVCGSPTNPTTSEYIQDFHNIKYWRVRSYFMIMIITIIYHHGICNQTCL